MAADDKGLTLEVDDGQDGPVHLAYSDIDKARTVFVWGPEPRTKGTTRTKGNKAPAASGAASTRAEEKRKQVVTP